jgi:hypothetical protein
LTASRSKTTSSTASRRSTGGRFAVGCGAAISADESPGAMRGKSAALLLGFTQEKLLIVLVQIAWRFSSKWHLHFKAIVMYNMNQIRSKE